MGSLNDKGCKGLKGPLDFDGKRGGDLNLAGDAGGVVFSSVGNNLVPWT